MLLNCGVGEDSWYFLGLQEDPSSQSWGKSVLNIHWKDWCWGWSFNILATWCKEQTHWKRPWCWERLKEGGEGDDRGWDSWLASPIRWTWVWASSGSQWWTGKPGVLHPWGRKESDTTEQLNWTKLNWTECRAFLINLQWPARDSLSSNHHPPYLINWGKKFLVQLNIKKLLEASQSFHDLWVGFLPKVSFTLWLPYVFY